MTTATEALAQLKLTAESMLAEPSLYPKTLALAQHVLDTAEEVDADGPPPPPCTCGSRSLAQFGAAVPHNEGCPARLFGWVAPDYDDTAWRTERTTDVRFTADRDSDGRSWAVERPGWTPADPADRTGRPSLEAVEAILNRNAELEDTLADLGASAGRIIACGALIAHQRANGGCLCGWGQPGSTPPRIGDSYAEHLLDALEAAGVEVVYRIDPGAL